MKGWLIFTHSVRLVLSNLDEALRVSLVLYAVVAASQIASWLNPPAMTGGNEVELAAMNTEHAVQYMILAVLAIIASLWIAVAWHRFVLVGEDPGGWLPRWHGANMLGYLGRSILLGFLVVIAVAVVSVPLGLIAAGLPGLMFGVPFVIVAFGSVLFFRLGVVLPAAAIGEKVAFRQAWAAMKGESGTIVVLATLVVGASLLLQLPTLLSGDPYSLISLIYGLVVNWFATIIGISVLTTLYGHFIERRPID